MVICDTVLHSVTSGVDEPSFSAILSLSVWLLSVSSVSPRFYRIPVIVMVVMLLMSCIFFLRRVSCVSFAVAVIRSKVVNMELP